MKSGLIEVAVSSADKSLVMDVGMYDGADTAYYLSLGYRVVAIEANPDCVALASERFASEIAAGELTIDNVAIGEKSGTISLQLSSSDLGASSTIPDWVAADSRGISVEIPCVNISSMLSKHGTPFYLKCDIEGADRHCILSLEQEHLPHYVSYEIGSDVIELLEHLAGIGYSDFKIINQINFMELASINSFRHRVHDKLYRMAGRSSPSFIRRNFRRFKSGHSSGPMGKYLAGKWYNYDQTRLRWDNFCAQYEPHQRAGWYDLHARLGV